MATAAGGNAASAEQLEKESTDWGDEDQVVGGLVQGAEERHTGEAGGSSSGLSSAVSLDQVLWP